MIAARFQFILISVLAHVALFYFMSLLFQADSPSTFSTGDMNVVYTFTASNAAEPVVKPVEAIAVVADEEPVIQTQLVQAVEIDMNPPRDVVEVKQATPGKLLSSLNDMNLVEVTGEPLEKILAQSSQNVEMILSNTEPHMAMLESGYREDLQKAIARHKRYPLKARRRGEEGEVEVSFSVLKNGAITGIQIASSSGYASLDRASSSALERLNRFKPIPKLLGRESWEFQVPVSFKLN